MFRKLLSNKWFVLAAGAVTGYLVLPKLLTAVGLAGFPTHERSKYYGLIKGLGAYNYEPGGESWRWGGLKALQRRAAMTGLGDMGYLAVLQANPNLDNWRPVGPYTIGRPRSAMGGYYYTGRDMVPFAIWPPAGQNWTSPFAKAL